MSDGKLDISSHLNDHTYPGLLLRHPRLIHLLYCWNGLLLQRNWAVKKELQKKLEELPNGHVVDAGCGEGMHLFPPAQRFPNLHFTGIDKNKNHLLFCENYIQKTDLKNVSVQAHDMERPIPGPSADLVICIGSLQYIWEDKSVIDNFHKTLKTNGKALVYVPVNGKTILSLYRHYFIRSKHYEKSQDRKRVYRKEEILGKLTTAGFTIEGTVFTYGKMGILAHEVYSLLLMGMGSGKWFSWVFGVSMALLFPIILLLKMTDYLTEKNNGNGMLIIAKKKAGQ